MTTDGNERTSTFRWSDPASAVAASAGKSGLEFLRAMIGGTVAPTPVVSAFGMTLTEVDAGRAVFELEPAEWMYNPVGSVHGGVVATMLDSCMWCAVQSTLPAGVGCTTVDLHVRYLRSVTHDTGRVIAEGTAIHVGRRTAAVEARLNAAGDGAVLAHATSGIAILG